MIQTTRGGVTYEDNPTTLRQADVWRSLRGGPVKGTAKSREAEMPSIESLPKATCMICSKTKIRGLFTPTELLREIGPRCRQCVGELSAEQRANKRIGRP